MPHPSQDEGFLPLPWQPKLQPRVDFDPKLFERLLGTHGQRLLWEVSLRCPCGGALGSQGAAITCPVCGGTGWEFGPLTQEVRAVVVGFNRQVLTYDRFGPFEIGTVIMAMRAEHTPAYGDRLTLIDSWMRQSETTVRAEGPKQRLRYAVASVTLQSKTGPAAQSVVFARKEANGIAGDVLQLGQDFVVTSDGRIDWTLGDTKGTAPRPGERFSIYYNCRPAFRVISYPHTVRATRGKKKSPDDYPLILPVSVICRLEHLALEMLV
jgi:hypothetical protein